MNFNVNLNVFPALILIFHDLFQCKSQQIPVYILLFSMLEKRVKNHNFKQILSKRGFSGIEIPQTVSSRILSSFLTQEKNGFCQPGRYRMFPWDNSDDGDRMYGKQEDRERLVQTSYLASSSTNNIQLQQLTVLGTTCTYDRQSVCLLYTSPSPRDQA